MAYWITIEFERNTYLIDLDRVSAFVFSPNGKITFWLPDNSQAIILHHHNRLDDYQKVVKYLKKISQFSLEGSWIKFIYDRHEYLVDLNRISSFCYAPNEKITFWIPDAKTPIVITKQSNPEVYQKIMDFMKLLIDS